MDSMTWALLGFILFICLLIGGLYWLASWRDKELRKQGLR